MKADNMKKFVYHIAAFLMLNAASGASAHDYNVEVFRWVDADTFDGSVSILPSLRVVDRFRLMCINAPESRGRHKSDEGVALSKRIKEMGLDRGTVEFYKEDAFGRYLAYFTPEGWEKSLNHTLFEDGIPLYSGLNKRERSECLRRFEK
jgi:endonuclease YncB( thermonuclease family)